MTKMSQVLDQELRDIRDALIKAGSNPVRAWQIRGELANKGIQLDESTIRGRFITMGEPLSGIDNIKPAQETPELNPTPQAIPRRSVDVNEVYDVPLDLQCFIPDPKEFSFYIERPVDKRLATHYDCSKYPITQGKQGTGKTFSHIYYAYIKKLPFFLFSGYEDFQLKKYFGDKTIINGSIVFQESLLVRAIQSPSVILFDEVNAISNNNTFDFHALLQNRELFIKDADNGKGKVYKLHPQCKIGFAQNPKSAKYIGGNIKPSNFLGRCTFITYPEFTKKELYKSVGAKYPMLTQAETKKFVDFYMACCEAINSADIPVDISIRQLSNVIDLYVHGLPLEEAIEDGLTSIMEAISQPKNKESFFRIAQAIWNELLQKSINEHTGEI